MSLLLLLLGSAEVVDTLEFASEDFGVPLFLDEAMAVAAFVNESLEPVG
jgi:hypothetical protein